MNNITQFNSTLWVKSVITRCLALVHWVPVASWISSISPQSAPLVWGEDAVNLKN